MDINELRRFALEIPAELPAPHVRAALATTVPAALRAAWRAVAAEHSDTGHYAAMIDDPRSLEYPFRGNQDAVAVVNMAHYAVYLERGHAGFHLPSRWRNWRYNRFGEPYARVPFRHYTPIRTRPGPTPLARAMYDPGGTSSTRRRQAMPEIVYALAKAMGPGERLTGFGEMYKQTKLYGLEPMPPQLAGLMGYTWRASKYEGMFYSSLPTPAGGYQQTGFITIRTIKPDSEGWYIPPMPAYRIAQRAMDAASSVIEQILSEAAMADAAAAMTGIMAEVGQ